MKNQTKIAATKNKQNAHTPTTDKGHREKERESRYRDAAYGNRERNRAQGRARRVEEGAVQEVLCAIQICTSNFYRTAQQRAEEAVININSWYGGRGRSSSRRRRGSKQQKLEVGE